MGEIDTQSLMSFYEQTSGNYDIGIWVQHAICYISQNLSEIWLQKFKCVLKSIWIQCMSNYIEIGPKEIE